eukprot:3275424-Lingulodinium_polyedra.AAC.1
MVPLPFCFLAAGDSRRRLWTLSRMKRLLVAPEWLPMSKTLSPKSAWRVCASASMASRVSEL